MSCFARVRNEHHGDGCVVDPCIVHQKMCYGLAVVVMPFLCYQFSRVVVFVVVTIDLVTTMPNNDNN